MGWLNFLLITRSGINNFGLQVKAGISFLKNLGMIEFLSIGTLELSHVYLGNSCWEWREHESTQLKVKPVNQRVSQRQKSSCTFREEVK